MHKLRMCTNCVSRVFADSYTLWWPASFDKILGRTDIPEQTKMSVHKLRKSTFHAQIAYVCIFCTSRRIHNHFLILCTKWVNIMKLR